MKDLARALRARTRSVLDDFKLPAEAKAEAKRDRGGLPQADPGAAAVIDASIDWLCAAQDHSRSNDGGVARSFSLATGEWATSYPETTGYIIPTMIEFAARRSDSALAQRAQRMLDWIASIQFPNGGFQGGTIDATSRVPVTFNTGQILLGLSSGVRRFGTRYSRPMSLAAGWLRDTLDSDGCWRRYPTPFAGPGEKVYETHVSWGLFEADRVAPGNGYGDAGLKQVHWALGKQRDNGWFDNCCLEAPAAPLTHTIGYALRGIIEAYLWRPEPELLNAATKTADGLLSVLSVDGRIAGRLRPDWSPAVEWVCLTGSAQIAHCWLLLFRITGNLRYLEAGRMANRFVRRTVQLDGPPHVRGGVKGSFPVNGEYGRFEYLNWAAKFCIDSNHLEVDLSG